MARNEQLVRQLKVLQLLEVSRYGKKLEELRDELVEDLGLTSLSDRTVRRDLEALQSAGFDVDTHDSPRGPVWKLGPSLRGIPKLEATATELLALSLVRDLLVPLTGTAYSQGLETLWKKMRDSLPEPIWKHFDRHRKHFHVLGTPAKNYAEQQGIISTLNRAIEQHRVAEIHYRSRDQLQATPREVEPLALAYYRGNLYLVAFACGDPPGSEPRHYKLDRFEKAVALDRYFQPAEEFDLEQHFERSMGVYKASRAADFEILLASEVVPWVAETPWHPGQQLTRHPDGSATLRIPQAYQEEIIPKVLGLGTNAEVIMPQACREEVQRIIQELNQRYSPAQTCSSTEIEVAISSGNFPPPPSAALQPSSTPQAHGSQAHGSQAHGSQPAESDPEQSPDQAKKAPAKD